jgi:hypothetical protein
LLAEVKRYADASEVKRSADGAEMLVCVWTPPPPFLFSPVHLSTCAVRLHDLMMVNTMLCLHDLQGPSMFPKELALTKFLDRIVRLPLPEDVKDADPPLSQDSEALKKQLRRSPLVEGGSRHVNP